MPQLLQACHPFTYPTSHSLPGLDGGHILRNRSCPKLSSCVGLIFSGFLLFYHLASLPPVFILLLLLVLCHPSLFPSALLLLLTLFLLFLPTGPGLGWGATFIPSKIICSLSLVCLVCLLWPALGGSHSYPAKLFFFSLLFVFFAF